MPYISKFPTFDCPPIVFHKQNGWARVILFLILCIISGNLWAQTLTADAPKQVAVGQQFRLSFRANTQDVKDFRSGQLPPELEVLIGPKTSLQQSIQIINGKTTKNESITYTYIVSATKAGHYSIPAAHITVAGKQISSNTLKIEVVDMGQGNGARQGGNNSNTEPEVRGAGAAITGSDLFIRVSANKSRVTEQEPVLLTYKVYTLVALTQLEGKMPDLQGFHTQEVPLPSQKSFHIEQLNGKAYRTVTWSQYVLFPQMTGKLKVPELVFNGIVEQRTALDPLEALLNGGAGYIEVNKQITAPGIEIEVTPLPDKPDDFCGGVGHFTVSAQLDKTTVKAGDPVTLSVVVSGAGNLQLIRQPNVDFPDDFDTYDPKVSDKTHLTTSGVEGNMVYDFLLVPRHQGDFEIPPVSLVYYDPSKGTYQSATTSALQLHVEKGNGSEGGTQDFNNQEDVELLANDIRHIHPVRTDDIRQKGEVFWGSTRFFSVIAFLLTAFFLCFLLLKRREAQLGNEVGQKAGRASKVAAKRLKKARKMMEESRTEEFYEEVMRALWGFVSDKLNIPVADLSQENIQERLSQHQVESRVIDQFIDALKECEFARYAPGDPRGNMHKVYNKSMTAIEKISDTLK